MGDKILLEVVDHAHGTGKGCFVAAAAHQDALRAKHLRHFGQHRGAAVGDHLVGETPEQRVRGDAGQAVGTAALKAELQLAEPPRLTPVVAHCGVQLVQPLQPRFHLVVLLLADHKAYALRVELAQRLAEHVHLIVFTPQPNHQHRAGVRMAHHVLQHGAGVFMILPEL